MKCFTLKSFSPPSSSAKRELLTTAHKPHQMEADPGQAAQTRPPSHKCSLQQQNYGLRYFLPQILYISPGTPPPSCTTTYTLGRSTWVREDRRGRENVLHKGWAPIKCIKNQVWELNSLSSGQPKSSFSLKLSSFLDFPRSPFQFPQAIIYLLPQRAHPSAPQVPTAPSLTPSVGRFRQSSGQLVEFVRKTPHFCVRSGGFTHQKLVWLLCSRLPAARYHFPRNAHPPQATTGKGAQPLEIHKIMNLSSLPYLPVDIHVQKSPSQMSARPQNDSV